MNIEKNKNFKTVSKFKKITKKEILAQKNKNHLTNDRMGRLKIALELDKNSQIDACFLVNKGHNNGMEIHCVSTEGIIYILNNQDYFFGFDCFITCLIARPEQVERLYRACNMNCPKDILAKARAHQIKKLNNDKSYLTKNGKLKQQCL